MLSLPFNFLRDLTLAIHSVAKNVYVRLLVVVSLSRDNSGRLSSLKFLVSRALKQAEHGGLAATAAD